LADPLPRVGYVVAYFHPFESGAERQALLQGAELVRRGGTVHVITHAVPGVPREENVRGLHVHRWVRSSKTGPLFAPTFVAGVVRALNSLRGEIDLVHTHQALWEAVGTGAAKLGGLRLPTLVQPASSGYFGEADELNRTRGRAVLRRLILRNDAFAAISADIADQWRVLGVPADRLARTCSGVDADHFRPGPPDPAIERTLPSGPRVVFTGRLHPQKNLDLLLDAWPAVARQTNANLLMIGHGPDRDRLAARAKALGVADSVHLLGAVPDPAEHLRAAVAFVLPSVAEGMSNSLLEAMSTGLPCLATAIGGNTDLIRDRESGRLLPPDRSSDWSEALIEILEDPAASLALGAAARATIEAQFALPVVVDRYVELYRRLLAGGPINGPG